MNTDDIRALIGAHPRSSDGYPQHVRDAVGRYVQQRRDAGARWTELVAEVGISSASLRVWMNAIRSGFHQVVLVDEAEAIAPVDEGLVITSPSGFTLTGCSLEQAAAVLSRVR